MASANFPVPTLLFSGLKNAAKVLGEAGKIPLQQTILDAQQQILEMMGTIHELKVKLGEAEKELKEMRETQASAVGGVRWANHFWQRKDDSPCCLFCWENRSACFT
jgi:hypothetical protein